MLHFSDFLALDTFPLRFTFVNLLDYKILSDYTERHCSQSLLEDCCEKLSFNMEFKEFMLMSNAAFS